MLGRERTGWLVGWLRELGIAGGVLALFATFGVGCSGCGGCFGGCSCTIAACEPVDFPDAPFPFDGGIDGGRDGGRRDAPFSTMDVLRERCDYVTEGSNIGSRCAEGGCASPYVCSALVVSTPDAERDLTPAFCTSACSLDDGTCGPCARCITAFPVGMSRLPTGEGSLDGVCAPRCVPSALDRGTCLPGFTCELTARVCVPACASDGDCTLIRGADGVFTALPDGAASCDVLTGRCVHPEPAEPLPAGSLCTSDVECGAREHCFHDPHWADDVSLCVRLACDLPTRECDEGQDCLALDEGAACRPDCGSDGECPAHLRCDLATHTCWRNCDSDLDCTATETCTAEDGRPCEGFRCGCRAIAPTADVDAGTDVDAGVPDLSDAGEADAGDADGGDDA